MGCNCGNKGPRRGQAAQPRQTRTPNATTASAEAVAAGSQVFYEVWRGGRYTGRRSTSIVSATNMAARLGGEVRPAKK